MVQVVGVDHVLAVFVQSYEVGNALHTANVSAFFNQRSEGGVREGIHWDTRVQLRHEGNAGLVAVSADIAQIAEVVVHGVALSVVHILGSKHQHVNGHLIFLVELENG